MSVDPESVLRALVNGWASEFSGKATKIAIASAEKRFSGRAITRVRAPVQHDAYERIIEVDCLPSQHSLRGTRSVLSSTVPLIENVRDIGLNADLIESAVQKDTALAEFRRFYLERRNLEERAAADDERKRHKLHEDFTPRLSIALVGLEGTISRSATVNVTYFLDGTHEYKDSLSLDIDEGRITSRPETEICMLSGRALPANCLAVCNFTGVKVLRHLLAQSEISGRYAQAEFVLRCSLTGKQVLKDEAETSFISGALVTKTLLKTSAVSGKRAEPSYFARCEITSVEVLSSELLLSELSGKLFRSDQSAVSTFTGKRGHSSEFVNCQETRQLIARTEAEQCQLSGSWVRPGVLMDCQVSGKRVLPSELQCCALTGKKVLREYLVTSSVSELSFLRTKAIKAAQNENYCMEEEAVVCAWSGRRSHPSDIAICRAAGMQVRNEYLASNGALIPITQLLEHTLHSQDHKQIWPLLTERVITLIGNRKVRTQAAILSPDGQSLAFRCEVKSFMGFKTNYVAAIFSISDGSVVGRVVRSDDFNIMQRRA